MPDRRARTDLGRDLHVDALVDAGAGEFSDAFAHGVSPYIVRAAEPRKGCPLSWGGNRRVPDSIRKLDRRARLGDAEASGRERVFVKAHVQVMEAAG